MELKPRFLVIKLADMQEALTTPDKQRLQVMLTKIDEWRLDHGKKLNTYVVINTDEPYFPLVAHLMELYGER